MESPIAPPPQKLRRCRIAFWISGGLAAAFPVLGFLATQGVARWLDHHRAPGSHHATFADLRTILLPFWIGILLGGASLLAFLGTGVRLNFLKRSAVKATIQP